MFKHILIVLTLVSCSSLIRAASPTGAISSAKPVWIRDVKVSFDGVPSWPVVAGDEIATEDGPAVLKFRNGSHIVIGEHARVRLQSERGALRVRLMAGAITFRLKPRSGIAVSGLALPIVPPDYMDGSISIYRDSAYLALGSPATTGAAAVSINPFNLGYLKDLRNYDPSSLAGSGGNPNQTPPAPPPANLSPNSTLLPSISQTHP